MMKDWLLSDLSGNLEAYCRDVAQKAVQDYVQGILTADVLYIRILKEWVNISKREENPSIPVLKQIAQRICSHELHDACRSTDSELRNLAFRNVCIYLGRLLPHVRYADSLRTYTGAMEDVLQQTMETLQRKLCRAECPELRDPASFLKWTYMVLIHQARVFLQSYKREGECSSLDALPAAITEEWIDTSVRDPAERLVALELRQALVKIISAMRNQRYRQVLLYGIAGLDEQEVARRLHASLQDIYLWRHRAVKRLQATPEVIRMLRSLMDE